MWVLLALFLAAAAFGLPLGLWSRIRKKGRALEGEMRTELGGSLVLLSGCGIIQGMNRVPGVLALSRGHLSHRSVVLDYRGRTALDAIRGFTLEDTRTTARARVRKYRRAVVLALDAPNAPLPLFVLPRAEAEAWRRALDQAMPGRGN